MERAFKGMVGLMFGALIFVPALLMDHVFSSAGQPSLVVQLLEVVGLLLMVALPLLFWVVLPLMERYRRRGIESRGV